jgi:glycosyltransferase involved in cell wall biosynthesis
MERGGAEMRTLDLLRRVDRNQFHLEFCCTSGKAGALADEIHSLGSATHPIALGAGFAGKFKTLLRQGRYDVVHSHLLHTSGLLLKYAHQAGVPVRVAHFRSTDSGRKKTPRRVFQRWFLSRLIDRHATDILAVSQAAMRACWKAGWQNDPRCRVIYNGLDLSAFQNAHGREAARAVFGIAPEAPLYIHVGNLRPPKNHARVMEVFQHIASAEPQARLLLVGKGGNEIETALRAQANQAELSDRVVFAGERHDVPELLRTADLMLFPSLWEGLPGAVLEACAAGTPVLGSALPVIEEIAPHLRGLHYMSLSLPPAEWAAQARALRQAFSPLPERHAVADAFAKSVFNLDQCVAAHCRIWSKAEP